jgi:hypothetical protein
MTMFVTPDGVDVEYGGGIRVGAHFGRISGNEKQVVQASRPRPREGRTSFPKGSGRDSNIAALLRMPDLAFD